MANLPQGLDAPAALERLREGNSRFAGRAINVDALLSNATRDRLVEGQAPFAIVLSCSDSRVPAEMLFGCGLGDLFVVRVAGNVVAPSLIGSVEFAAITFGTRLVVVMGHSLCGAIKATIDALRSGRVPASENLGDIVSRIAPAIAELVRADIPEEALLKHAVRANVRASASHLRHGSRVLESLLQQHRLSIVGADYDLASGIVDFFDR